MSRLAMVFLLLVAACHHEISGTRVLEKKETFTDTGEPTFWVIVEGFDDPIKVTFVQYHRVAIGDQVELKIGCGNRQLVLEGNVKKVEGGLTPEEREWLREAIRNKKSKP